MGSEIPVIGSEGNQLYDVEETVFVAVGKHVRESESTLLWAVRNFPEKRICLLHVHQPSHLITFFDAKLSFIVLKQPSLKVLRELEVQKVHKLLKKYFHLLPQTEAQPDKVWIEMENIEKGIVKLVTLHGIRWLVMGAAADQHYATEMTESTSSKAIYVCQHAPNSCQIWFPCMGCLIYTREAKKDNPIANLCQEQLPLNLKELKDQSEDKKQHHVSQKLGSLQPLTSEEHPSILQAKSVDVGSCDVNSIASSSPKSVRTSRRCMTLAEADHSFENVEPVILSHNSLNFRKLAQKKVPNPCALAALDAQVFDSFFSHKGVKSIYFLNIKMFLHCLHPVSNESSLLINFIQREKARSRTAGEIHGRLQQASWDDEQPTQVSFGEPVRGSQCEEDTMDPKLKDETAESPHTEVRKQRKESEAALVMHKKELETVKGGNEKYVKELGVVESDNSLLQSQIAESVQVMEELEEKIISGVDLLISFRNRRDQLKIEAEKARCELERLRRLKYSAYSVPTGRKFSMFSFVEISEATSDFDPSKKIGEGRYGSVYHGLIRHTKVAIKTLPHDGSQNQLEFLNQVEVISRVRHPNLVSLIGICRESRSLVYEFMERGSLEDHLGRGDKTPLRWRTRIRIAIQICSALIFLHKNNPPIAHGNLKPSKILMDSNFVTKISDLGVLHLRPKRPRDQLHGHDSDANCSSQYMDPETLETGEMTPGSDLYAFGIILLCLITGRASLGIVEDVKHALQKDIFGSMLDILAGDWPALEAESLARLAIKCCTRRRSNQPDLASQVWSVLQMMRDIPEAAHSCLDLKEKCRPPSYFLCPIYQEVMKDPYTAEDGFTYEQEAIQGWFCSGHKTSPMTNLKLDSCDLVPNHALYYAIQDWTKR
ncbi:U-box domain-containing protein [Drosera capensis]